MKRAATFLATGIVIAATVIPTANAAERHTMKKSSPSFASIQRGGQPNGDGYPTPGRAFEACGGAGNVFVIYDEMPDGSTQNHRFYCVD